MKKLASTLCLAALVFVAAAPAVLAQDYTGDVVEGRLHRPDPSPGANQKPAAETSAKTEAVLATDEKGKKTATTFASNTPTIYLVIKNLTGAKGDKVRTLWVADDTGKVLPKNKTLTDNTMALPNAGVFNPTFNQPAPIKGVFPPGKYHVTLYVGAKEITSLKFTVK